VCTLQDKTVLIVDSANRPGTLVEVRQQLQQRCILALAAWLEMHHLLACVQQDREVEQLQQLAVCIISTGS
jgi:hypothetical protein